MSTQLGGCGGNASGTDSKLKRQLAGDNKGDGATDIGGTSCRDSTDKHSNEWWEKCNDIEFRKEFRINRSTFDFIYQELSYVFKKGETTATYPLRTRVAVCLWKLATGATNPDGSRKFGLLESTIGILFHEVCSTIRKHLKPKFLQWPTEEILVKIQTEFESIYKIPNVVGCLQTNHIPIATPRKEDRDGYCNFQRSKAYKGAFHSIIVQAVVNHEGDFIDVDIGKPGKLSNYDVLLQSQLYKSPEKLVEGVWVVGNKTFPIMNKILAPYMTQRIHDMTPSQMMFNNQIARIQKIATDAFVRLKGRWLCLQKPILKHEDASDVVEACCVLHNICQSRKDALDTKWFIDDVSTNTLPPPATSVMSDEARQARDNIAHGLSASEII